MLVSDLVTELPKSQLPAGTATLDGEFPFYVSGPKPLRCDVAIRDGEAIVLSTGGKAAIHFGEGAYSYSTDCWSLEPIQEKVIGKFLYYFLDSQLYRIDALGFEGSGLRHLRKKFVRDYRVPEQSILEQLKIAEVLSTVDQAIGQTEMVIAKQQRIKTGLMQDVLTRGVDEQGNLRSEETHEFKDSPLGRIPVEWDVVQLGSLTKNPESITYGVLKPGTFVEGGIPLLQIEDVIHGDIEIAKLHRIGPELDAQYKRTRLQGGEVVVSLVGTIGRIAHLSLSIRGANLHRNLALVRIVEPHSSRFVFHYLRSETGQEEIANNSLGSTQALFNLGSLRALRVLQPDSDEQSRIAERIDAGDSIISASTIEKHKLVALKIALMQDLLSGEKRVTPLLDPVKAA